MYSSTVYLYVEGCMCKPSLCNFSRVTVLWSGMKIKYVNVNGRNVCYGERGQKQKGKSSMILLHGFSADKSMWAPLVRVSRKHLIPTLPCFIPPAIHLMKM